MTVKELKEQLNKYEDNMLVMIPRSDTASDTNFPYRPIQFVSRGVNECDMCLFLEDNVCCDTCINSGYDPEEGPCANCNNYDEWEELK